MTRAQIRAAMMALAARAETYLPDLNSGDRAKVKEARSLHAEAMSEFTVLDSQLTAMDKVDERAAQAGDAQFGALVQRGSLAALVTAVIGGHDVDGATAELQAERSLQSNQVPLDLLTRAVTTAPTDTGASQPPIVPLVFADGDLAFMSIPQHRVPSGDVAFPVLTSHPTVGGPHEDSTSVAETTGAFSADLLPPGRIQASFFYRRTDGARFAGMDQSLRMALSGALSEALDKQMAAQIVTDVTRIDATAANTFATYRKVLVHDRLDGRYAATPSELALLVGSATYASMASKARAASSDVDVVENLTRSGVRIRISPHIAAASASKQDVVVRRGTRADAAVALWEGPTLIPDEITGAKKGEITLTAVMLAAWAVTRDAGFSRVQVQHA